MKIILEKSIQYQDCGATVAYLHYRLDYSLRIRVRQYVA